MSAATDAAGALTLLLEVTTVRSVEDPRADALPQNLTRACDQLTAAAESIDTCSLRSATLPSSWLIADR